jgi:hypothetical protein
MTLTDKVTLRTHGFVPPPTAPVHAVYPIVPSGPAIIVLNEYSTLFRVDTTQAHHSLPEEPPERD